MAPECSRVLVLKARDVYEINLYLLARYFVFRVVLVTIVCISVIIWVYSVSLGFLGLILCSYFNLGSQIISICIVLYMSNFFFVTIRKVKESCCCYNDF